MERERKKGEKKAATLRTESPSISSKRDSASASEVDTEETDGLIDLEGVEAERIILKGEDIDEVSPYLCFVIPTSSPSSSPLFSFPLFICFKLSLLFIEVFQIASSGKSRAFRLFRF